MRSNKDIRYSPKIDDIVYLIKDVKTHIGKKNDDTTKYSL